MPYTVKASNFPGNRCEYFLEFFYSRPGALVPD